MAPLPDNSTARVWVDYNDGVNDHSLMIRYSPSGATVADAMDAAIAFLEAMDPLLYLIGITGARASAAGSTFSFPVAWTGAATYGDDTMDPVFAPRETRFLGRDNGGRRVSWSLYGGKYETPENYRLNPLDFAAVASAISAIEANVVADTFLTINYGDPIVYPYADVNFNSYWERQARG